MTADIETMIAAFERAIASEADYAMRLIGLAEVVAARKHSLRALELCRKAIALDPGNHELAVRARRLSHSLIPRYHLPMMHDAARNAAWEAAFRRAIRPGAHVFEIGTGGGMLALLAARAGAARVVTCEHDPLIATLAREIVALNGFDDRITVINKRARDVQMGVDLERPADLLFCDIFSNHMFGYEPLRLLADVRARLLAPEARVLPQGGSIRLALAYWPHHQSSARLQSAAGFDLSPMTAFAPTSVLVPRGALGFSAMSQGVDGFRLDFNAADYPAAERRTLTLEATADGDVNGIAQWIRLELDEATMLDAGAAPEGDYFLRPIFHALPCELPVRKGDTVAVHLDHDGRQLTIWT